MRPDWDDTFLEVARVMARRSLCSRAQVGAVVVSVENRIVATGYNGPPAGLEHGERPCQAWCTRSAHGPTPDTLKSYEDCPALHAEANALSVCDRSTREGGTLYVTGHCCWTCAKLVANSGLSRVVMSVTDDGDRTYRSPALGHALLSTCGLEVVWR